MFFEARRRAIEENGCVISRKQTKGNISPFPFMRPARPSLGPLSFVLVLSEEGHYSLILLGVVITPPLLSSLSPVEHVLEFWRDRTEHQNLDDRFSTEREKQSALGIHL